MVSSARREGRKRCISVTKAVGNAGSVFKAARRERNSEAKAAVVWWWSAILRGMRSAGGSVSCCLSWAMSHRSRCLRRWGWKARAMILSERIFAALGLEDQAGSARVDAVGVAKHHGAAVVAGDGADIDMDALGGGGRGGRDA